MKPKYLTRLTQYDAFISFCKKNEPIFKKLRGFSLIQMQFRLRYAIITVTWQQYVLLLNGSGPGVMALKQSLCILAATIGEALATTHAENNKPTPSASELEKLKDDQLINHCQKLYQRVVQKPGVFAQTGHVLEIRNTLTGAIDLYNAAISPPRVQKVHLIFLQQRLDKLFVEADAMLKTELEPLIKKIKAKHPQTYSQYAFIKKLKQGEIPGKVVFVKNRP
jgi:hypothetical protein